MDAHSYLDDGPLTKQSSLSRQIARHIGAKDTVVNTLGAIRQYIRKFKHITSKGYQKTATQILRDKKWSSNIDYALAFVVLARALRIPVRWVDVGQECAFIEIKLRSGWRLYSLAPQEDFIMSTDPYQIVAKGLDPGYLYKRCMDGTYAVKPGNITTSKPIYLFCGISTAGKTTYAFALAQYLYRRGGEVPVIETDKIFQRTKLTGKRLMEKVYTKAKDTLNRQWRALIIDGNWDNFWIPKSVISVLIYTPLKWLPEHIAKRSKASPYLILNLFVEMFKKAPQSKAIDYITKEDIRRIQQTKHADFIISKLGFESSTGIYIAPRLKYSVIVFTQEYNPREGASYIIRETC